MEASTLVHGCASWIFAFWNIRIRILSSQERLEVEQKKNLDFQCHLGRYLTGVWYSEESLIHTEYHTLQEDTVYQYKDQEYDTVQFDGRDLRYGELISCVFTRCTFMNTEMDEIETSNCRFIECDFRGVTLNASSHTESAFENCTFGGANLFVSKFTSCKMTGSDFSGAQMDGISMIGGDWSYTNLRHIKLGKQDLRGIRFHEVDFSDTDLGKADLRDCDMSRATLTRTKLTGTDLRGANLEGIDLKSMDVKGARMDREQAVLFMRSYGAKVD